jgi:hypothetical protein
MQKMEENWGFTAQVEAWTDFWDKEERCDEVHPTFSSLSLYINNNFDEQKLHKYVPRKHSAGFRCAPSTT